MATTLMLMLVFALFVSTAAAEVPVRLPLGLQEQAAWVPEDNPAPWPA